MIVWISKALVLAMHERQLAEHGGKAGVRDEALLDAVLARPQQLYAGGEARPDLAALADTIEARGVRVVFTEQLESSNDADRLAERLGVRVIPLVTDALTDDPATDTYVEMMRTNATAIAEALAP